MTSLLLPAILLAALAILIIYISARLRRRSGLPDGEIVYQDASGLAKESLYSKRYGLKGKPDYLLKDRSGNLIPVEVKSTNAPRNSQPYESHLLQLAAYLLLIEETLERPAPYGLIRYRDRTIRIDNTDELIDELIEVIDEMREWQQEESVPRSHDDPRRCRNCSMAHACDERIE